MHSSEDCGGGLLVKELDRVERDDLRALIYQ